MNDDILCSLRTLLNYNYKDEKRHYCECYDTEDAEKDIETLVPKDKDFAEKRNHIFYDISKLLGWLDGVEE